MARSRFREKRLPVFGAPNAFEGPMGVKKLRSEFQPA